MPKPSGNRLPPVTDMVRETFSTAGQVMGRTWIICLAYLAALSLMFVLTPFVAGIVGLSSAFLISVGWLAVVVRTGLGSADGAVSGNRLGVDEARIAVSAVAVGLALLIVSFLLFLFLIIFSMIMVAVAGYDGDTLDNDPTFFQNPENVAAFLATTEGAVLGVVAVGCLGVLFWLGCRLSPFAAGAVAQKRIVALQAIVWTRYQDVKLCFAAIGGLLPIMLVWLGTFAGLQTLSAPSWLLSLVHAVGWLGVVTVFGAYSARIYKHLIDLPDT